MPTASTCRACLVSSLLTVNYFLYPFSFSRALPPPHPTSLTPLPVADGTPRDCSTNRCGSQADTAIIRDREIRSGEVGPLGRTQGNGPIDAATMVASFMGTGSTPSVNAANASVGVEDDLSGLGRGGRNNNKREEGSGLVVRQFLKGLFGGGGTTSKVATESNVAATAGNGADTGLPTCGDDGSIEMVFHQVSFSSSRLDGDSG